MLPDDPNFLNELDVEPIPPEGPARVLLAAPDSPERRAWCEALRRAGHVVTCADSDDSARRALATITFDAAVIHVQAWGGDGFRLARHLHRCQFRTRMVLLTESTSFELALEALRLGAVDVIPLPADEEAITYGVACAVLKTRESGREERRINRLRDMCRKLNAANMESSRQVEVLCQDLANAYEDIADQLNEVAMASEFRTLLGQELELEGLLRTAMEYLLSKIGPTNAAVFLPDPHGEYSLGAYVNYNCPRENADVLLDHLCRVVCPQMEAETEIVRFNDAAELAEWLGADAAFLAACDVVAFHCKQGDDCLAVMVLFRDRRNPFAENLPSIIDTLRPIFARQVSSVIRVHHRARPQWPREAAEEGWETDEDYGLAA